MMKSRKTVVMFFVIAVLSCLLAPSAMAGKPSVAVSEFTNDTSAGWWGSGVGEDLAAMLSNELSSGGKLKVLERKNMDAVLSEQDLAETGRINKKTAAKVGQITGAQYLIMGTVSSFEEDTSSTGGGISIGPITLGGQTSDAYVAIDLRVIDTTTGEVAYSRTIEGRASSSGVDVGAYFDIAGGSLGSQKRTPAGKAIRACLVECAEYLECVMVDQDGCEAEYQGKEKRRREKTKSAISLD